MENQESPQPRPPRIAIFGGTFDPIHRGHLLIMDQARQQANLDQVVLLPCYHSPHKAKGPVATGPQRLEMARLAVAEQKWDWATVSDWEIERQGPSYSWQTCQHFHGLHPDAEFFWILGADQWTALPNWSQADYLATHLTFLVFARNGESPAAQAPFRFKPLRGEISVSSTEIREKLYDGQSVSHLLPGGVVDYVTRSGVYSGRIMWRAES